MCILLILTTGLQACSTSVEPVSQTTLLSHYHDQHFSPVDNIPTPQSLFTLSGNQIDDIKQSLSPKAQRVLVHQWLAQYINAYEGGFQYADNVTRTASETFDDRKGNCLSLVLLTAAIAQELGVSVVFQQIDIPPVWDRQGGVYLINGHINLKLLPQEQTHVFNVDSTEILVDFLPARTMQGYGKRKVSQSKIISMFYNNIAADALVIGDYNRAYSLVKMSLQQQDVFLPALNTLAVLYRYKGLNAEAEALYKLALAFKPNDMDILTNYSILLAVQNRLAEWGELHRVIELARIRNPYYYYGIAQQAYNDKEYQTAINWYKKAIDKADYRHEFYFGLSRSYWAMGDQYRSQIHMQKALSLSTDIQHQRRYQAKLNAMN
ncbi:tetratricopeptide repeat protein [Shewanella youngdeokensis]|uniref:Tetratricopeptide repeat protein n=1 Tax=Shewanella youngdeokensis TaxID=2999068 RepID=A0ABZ0K028_9GAMM|nr:hypothetical protein RGE70_03530 [Shewanella sp. DAU334]